MSDRSQVLVLRAAALMGTVFAVIATWLVISSFGIGIWLSEFDAFIVLFALFFAVSVWLVAPRQPHNAVVWTMAMTAFFGGVVELGSVAPLFYFDIDPALVETLVPATLPAGAAWVIFSVGWTWVLAMIPLLTFGLLLFPDGKLPSPRWRGVGIFSAVSIGILTAVSFWSYRPWSTEPVDTGAFVNVGFLLVFVAVVLSLAALVGRFRRSQGATRQQIKWIIWGASIFIPVFLGLGFLIGGGESEYLLFGPIMTAEAIFLASYGIAIGKYRLYDVDFVISRTLVYATLAVFFAAVYVAVVVGGGSLFGAADHPSPWLGIGATVVIALAFQPLRRRVQRIANRVVFGRRATPYEVLSSFSQRIDAVNPGVLETVARSLAEGTAADEIGIWTAAHGHPQRIAVWPTQASLPEDPRQGVDRIWEITHDGELMGYVGIDLGAGQVLPPHDEELVDRVTSGLGLALRNLQLTGDLQTRVRQLRESRRRIVAAQDQTRRRLERDLHDGAQQRLVALKIKLGISASMAEAAGLEDVKAILDAVKDESDLTIDSLRNLARGIYPPLLEAEGLGPALTAQLQRAPLPVTVQAAGVGRHPRDVEATVYFCVLEAVQNAVRHSQGKSVLVTVGDQNGHLAFEVRDDGIGFDFQGVSRGPGLTNIADRIDALGGELEVESSQGRGTRIGARIPVEEGSPV